MSLRGVIRKIDPLGRITIPSDFRKVNGWEEGDEIELLLDGKKVVIQPYRYGEERQRLMNTLYQALNETTYDNPQLQEEIKRQIELIRNNAI